MLLSVTVGMLSFAPQSGRFVSQRFSPDAARLAKAPAMELGLAATIVRDVAALPTMYALMSLNEYMTHRYFQHLEFNRPESLVWLKTTVERVGGPPVSEQKLPGDGHVEHHAETFDDMSLKNDERWRKTPASKSLDDDPFRGTAFHWHATGIMTLQMLPSVLPTYLLMGWSVQETLAILLPSMLVHALVWNAIHPPMHGLPPVPLTVGFGTVVPGGKAFSNTILESSYGHYIFENHMGHHVLSGQCNYNVCCPMTDHLLGTYVPTAQWQPKMRPLPLNAEVRGPAVEPSSFGGVPQLPTRDEWEAAKMLRKQMRDGDDEMSTLANGGMMIADAYDEAPESATEPAAVR